MIIDDALKYVEDIFKNDYTGHDFSHTLRVYKLAILIAKKEKADESIVGLAALLHDVDDYKLSPDTYKDKGNARKFLNEHQVDEKTVELICQIIDEVTFSASDSKTPSTLEGMCVQDSDRLDAIGAIGIARAFAYGASHKRKMYDPNVKPKLNMTKEEYFNGEANTINHFYEKLFLLKDMMNTKTAKELAVNRDKLLHEFVDEFIKEWEVKEL